MLVETVIGRPALCPNGGGTASPIHLSHWPFENGRVSPGWKRTESAVPELRRLLRGQRAHPVDGWTSGGLRSSVRDDRRCRPMAVRPPADRVVGRAALMALTILRQREVVGQQPLDATRVRSTRWAPSSGPSMGWSSRSSIANRSGAVGAPRALPKAALINGGGGCRRRHVAQPLRKDSVRLARRSFARIPGLDLRIPGRTRRTRARCREAPDAHCAVRPQRGSQAR